MNHLEEGATEARRHKGQLRLRFHLFRCSEEKHESNELTRICTNPFQFGFVKIRVNSLDSCSSSSLLERVRTRSSWPLCLCASVAPPLTILSPHAPHRTAPAADDCTHSSAPPAGSRPASAPSHPRTRRRARTAPTPPPPAA